MNIQNDTPNFYYIGDYALSGGATIVVPDFAYNNDDAIAKQINYLDDTGCITVTLKPSGYPRTFGSAVAAVGGDPYEGRLQDKPPASPSDSDDEFESETLDSAWTWRNQGTATIDLSSSPGALIFNIPGSSQDNKRGIDRPVPGGTWSLRAKLDGIVPYASNTASLFGIYVANSAFNKMVSIYVMSNSWGGWTYEVRVSRFTTFVQGSSTEIFTSPRDNIPVNYFRIDYDGTKLKFYMSKEGSAWLKVVEESVSSHLGTVDVAGLCGGSYQGSDFPFAVSFFRFV